MSILSAGFCSDWVRQRSTARIPFPSHAPLIWKAGGSGVGPFHSCCVCAFPSSSLAAPMWLLYQRLHDREGQKLISQVRHSLIAIVPVSQSPEFHKFLRWVGHLVRIFGDTKLILQAWSCLNLKSGFFSSFQDCLLENSCPTLVHGGLGQCACIHSLYCHCFLSQECVCVTFLHFRCLIFFLLGYIHLLFDSLTDGF